MLRQRFRHMLPAICGVVFGVAVALLTGEQFFLLLSLYAVAGMMIMYFYLMALSDIHLRKHNESLDAAPVADIKEEVAEDVKKIEEAVVPKPPEEVKHEA